MTDETVENTTSIMSATKRRTFTLLTIQLVMILAIICSLSLIEPIRAVVTSNMAILYYSDGLMVANIVVLFFYLYRHLMKNLFGSILLFIITIISGSHCGMICANFKTSWVIVSIIFVIFLCISLTAVAIINPYDVTKTMNLIFLPIWLVVVGCTVYFFWPNLTLNWIILIGFLLSSSAYFIVDSQMIIGGQEQLHQFNEEVMISAIICAFLLIEPIRVPVSSNILILYYSDGLIFANIGVVGCGHLMQYLFGSILLFIITIISGSYCGIICANFKTGWVIVSIFFVIFLCISLTAVAVKNPYNVTKTMRSLLLPIWIVAIGNVVYFFWPNLTLNWVILIGFLLVSSAYFVFDCQMIITGQEQPLLNEEGLLVSITLICMDIVFILLCSVMIIEGWYL